MFEAMMQWFGYGHPGSRIWIVGLEEHCDSIADIKRRITLRTANPQTFLDIEEFHIAAQGRMPQIGEVSVWNIASQIYAGVYDTETQIGRVNPQTSDLLLSEILPLPRQQHHHWPEPYHDWFPTPKEYEDYATPIMVQRLLDMVNLHGPEVVILHGKGHHDTWIQQSEVMNVGWNIVPVAGHRTHTISWQLLNDTLWIRTNNLVNNGWIRFGPSQIQQVIEIIRTYRPGGGGAG